MKWLVVSTLLVFTSLQTSKAFAADAKVQAGVVNFSACVTDSKYGKNEQSAFESLRKQMASLLEDTEKQLNEIAAKFNDAEYMDGLSPQGEEDLKNKFRALNEEMNRYQNQYQQVLNQAHMKILHSLNGKIQQAAEKIAKEKKLNMVLNKEACFFCMPTLDVTAAVVAEMDKTFELDSNKKAVVEIANPTPSQTAQTEEVAEKEEAKK